MTCKMLAYLILDNTDILEKKTQLKIVNFNVLTVLGNKK